MFPRWWMKGQSLRDLDGDEPYPGAFRETGRWLVGFGLLAFGLGAWRRSPLLAMLGLLFLSLGGAMIAVSKPARERRLAKRGRETPLQPYRQPARVEYLDGRPAWPVRVVHPSRFRGVEYDVQFELFRLPQGAILACLLRLYDIPESPYFLHRVFDVSFPPVHGYLRALADGSEWTLLLESKGTEGSVRRELEVNGRLLGRLLHEAERFNSGLRRVEGGRALDQFLTVFEPEAEKGGCEAGWKAVNRWAEKHGRTEE